MPDTIYHELAGDLRDFALGHPILSDAPREHACDHECRGMDDCSWCRETVPRVESVPVPPTPVRDDDVVTGLTILGALCGIIGALLAWWLV